MVEYDVLGNERHKAICKLREMPKLYPSKDGSADVFAWKRELANAIGADTELFSAIRNRLIHLLGGDQPKLSGILMEDDDGVDAGPSDAASADSPDHGSAGCACGSRCGELDEEVAPITTELREYMETYRPSEDAGHVVASWIGTIGFEGFDRLCDNIDAIHAGLERENDELQRRTKYPAETERINMLEREVKRLTSECTTQRNNFDQATSAREHWKNLYEQSLEQIHDLEHDVEMWRDRAEDMRMERDDALKEHHAWAPESHYMMLPKDSDGIPVHIGDVMEWPDGGDEPFEVVGIGENGTLFYMYDGSCEWTKAKNKVHHAPTVEDVLREMLDAWGELPSNATNEAIIAEYADKLKLADA